MPDEGGDPRTGHNDSAMTDTATIRNPPKQPLFSAAAPRDRR